MSLFVTNLIASVLLPPTSILIFFVAALLTTLSRKRQTLGLALLALCLVTLWAVSTPYIAQLLISTLESRISDDPDCNPLAIVALGAGTYYDAPEYGADTVTPFGLERLRRAAILHRETGLPVLVSGGNPDRRPKPEAALMQEVLENDFSVHPVWTEANSNTTRENAKESWNTLQKKNIRSVYVVSQAWHLPRALASFREAGFCVVSAPTGFATGHLNGINAFVPSAKALFQTFLVGHEALGIVWYALSS